ncbi:MAG: hypothetical protein EBX52_02030 [Proteobacteria bacterium]|nr:hypothetical protein [Pseudomonadota bacterium]
MIEAVFFGSRWRYVWQRIRFVLLQKTVQVGVRYVEWLSFRKLIGPQSAFYYLLVRHLFEFVVRYRWGSLEGMRQELRALYRDHRHAPLVERIRREWSNAFVSGGGALVFGGAVVAFTSVAGHESPVPLLISISAARFVSDFIQRTLRSFIYVTGRVYRPLWTMSGLDLFHGGILYFYARNHGLEGVLIVTLVDAVIRTAVGWKILLANYQRSRLPRLVAPRWRWTRLRPSLETIRSGFTLPWIEGAFLIAGLVGFNAFKEWDEFGGHTLWLYLMTPMWFSAIGFYMLYYVDFLKFGSRLFRRARSVLFLDSIRALLVFAVFSAMVAFALDSVQEEPIGWMTLPGVMLPVFAWGFYGCSLALAFIQGRRESVMVLGVLTGVAVAWAWDYLSLGVLLIGAPLLAGFLGILLSVRENPRSGPGARCSPFAFLHLIESGLSGQAAVQGVLLDRSNLGFSVPLTFSRLEAVLPVGSRYALFGRSHLWWWMPGAEPFTRPELFGIFGAHWNQVLEGVPEVPERKGVETRPWTPGERLNLKEMGFESGDLRTLWREVRSSVEGGGMKRSLKGWRYQPVFKEGVWTGGSFVRSLPGPHTSS